MQSELLLGAIGVLILAPGAAAALLAYGPGEVGIVTRCAAAFGLGFAIAGGCAFALAVTHIFWLTTYLPLWLALTVALWVRARLKVSLRLHASALAAEFDESRVPLLLGAAIFLALMVVRSLYLHSLPGPHYVYILNGINIANSHGVPGNVLEYGQAQPPATDKIFLDAFTGVLVLFNNNPLVAPGVLLWLAYAGAVIGMWAAAWELGLRWVAIVLPVLMLADTALPGTRMTDGFSIYRAEDFGIAVAFCGLAMAVLAVRSGGRTRALLAGVVLAAASGSHLIPLVIVVVMFAAVLVGDVIRPVADRTRKALVLDGCLVGASGGVLGLVIRLVAGGSFGLGGAANQSTYSVVHTSFDPTAFMANGEFIPRNRPELHHFYVRAGQVVQEMINSATHIRMSAALGVAFLVVTLVVALVLARIRPEFSGVGFAGVGVLFGVTAIALYFSYRYHVWIEATFGIRRPTLYIPAGAWLLVLGIVETLLLAVRERRWKFGTRVVPTLCVAVVLLPAVVLIPSVWPSGHSQAKSTNQRLFATWVRTHTPCGSRFLLDQRSAGGVAALTGRYALDEGMGAFLRPSMLPHETQVLLAVRAFFNSPRNNEALLRKNHINYVVLAQEGLLGYPGPIGLGSVSQMQRARFLKQVLNTPSVKIYHVTGSTVEPVSPLLKGPYIHCRRSPAGY